MVVPLIVPVLYGLGNKTGTMYSGNRHYSAHCHTGYSHWCQAISQTLSRATGTIEGSLLYLLHLCTLLALRNTSLQPGRYHTLLNVLVHSPPPPAPLGLAGIWNPATSESRRMAYWRFSTSAWPELGSNEIHLLIDTWCVLLYRAIQVFRLARRGCRSSVPSLHTPCCEYSRWKWIRRGVSQEKQMRAPRHHDVHFGVFLRLAYSGIVCKTPKLANRGSSSKVRACLPAACDPWTCISCCM